MTVQKTLTEGNIRTQLITLALPLLVGNIFQQFYNTVDTIIVERYIGETAFAALGVAGTVMNLFIFIMGGCCTGIAIIAASLFGSKDYNSLRREFFLSAVLGTVFTALLSILGILGVPYILKIIQTPDSVALFAAEYLKIILLGMFMTFFYNLFAAILRATGNTRTALLFLLISIVSNIFLDILFVSVFEMGVSGAAWATVCAQSLSAFLCLFYIRRKLPFLRVQREDMHYDAVLVNKTAKYALISAMHQSSLYIGKLLVQGAVNSMGLAAISAYTATTRVEGIAQAFGDSGAESISIFVAQNTGAGNKSRARSGFQNGLVMLTLLGFILSFIIFISTKRLLHLFVPEGSTDVISYGVLYLHIISIFYFLCFIGSAFVGFYRGSGKVNIPLIGTTLHISVRVLLSYLLASSMGLGAIALATGIGWIVVVSYQTLIFRRIRCLEVEGQDYQLQPIMPGTEL